MPAERTPAEHVEARWIAPRLDVPVDAGLLWEVLSRHPTMHKAAQCVAVVEASGSYPIEHVDRLIAAFDHHVGHASKLRVDDCVLDRGKVVEHLGGPGPCAVDREELVSLVLVAFESARLRERGVGATGPRHGVTGRRNR